MPQFNVAADNKSDLFDPFPRTQNHRSQPAHQGNNHAVLLQEINRPFNMAINLQSEK